MKAAYCWIMYKFRLPFLLNIEDLGNVLVETEELSFFASRQDETITESLKMQ
jgi:hypothetical protein